MGICCHRCFELAFFFMTHLSSKELLYLINIFFHAVSVLPLIH